MASRMLRAAKLTTMAQVQTPIAHSFKIKSVENIPSFQLTATTYVHEKSGAQHLHLRRNDDSNKAFSVIFKTVPEDHTGVAHILEHTVLCGSKQFPVRDPFFKMLNRSLATFMNAMTGTDLTMYPFASQNSQDFHNLLEVYLDATFYPNLFYNDFRQEGWRLEHQDPTDRTTPLQFKGVVFSEMKGAYSNASSFFLTRLEQALRPGTSYANDYGGDPIHILDLTHQQLREFHGRHYHPQNSRFFTYGDMDIDPILATIDRSISGRTDRPAPPADVGFVRRFKSPQTVQITGPPDPWGDETRPVKAAIAFLTTDITNTARVLAMELLSKLLTDGPASPLHQALIGAQIGTDYTPATGFSEEARETMFAVGLQGLSSIEDAHKVENIVMTTLSNVAANGFSAERIEAALHQFELSQKKVIDDVIDRDDVINFIFMIEQTNSFGVDVGMNVARAWIHGVDPVDLLRFDDHIAKLRQEIAKGGFFENLIESELLNNPHRLKFIVVTDMDYAQKEAENERLKLNKVVESLTAEHQQRIYEDSLQLLQAQEKEQDTSCLPTLRVTDVPHDLKRYSITKSAVDHVAVFSSEQPTNGLTYLRGLYSLDHIDPALQPYLPLYAKAITYLGTHQLSSEQYAQEIERYTGGIHVSPEVLLDYSDLDRGAWGLSFSSLALERHVPRLVELLSDTLSNPSFTHQANLKNLINMIANSDAITEHGHVYAQTYAAASLSRSAAMKELLEGVNNVQFMQQLAQGNVDDVIHALQRIHQHIRERGSFKVMLNATASGLSGATPHVASLIQAIRPKTPRQVADKEGVLGLGPYTSKTFLAMPIQMNYVAKAIKTVPYTHVDSPVLQVAASLMTTKFLQREIREKNGAYGGGASWSDGFVSFMSYRDPNTLKTLDTFDQAVQWLASGQFTDQAIDEAKLSIFGSLDAPIAPGDRGLANFYYGIDDDLRQKRRNIIFDMNRDSIIRATEQWLRPAASLSSVAIVGSSTVLQTDVAKQLVDEHWTVIQKD